MSEDTFGFNELTDAAQDNALETFAKYYVRQYKQDNLEIIDALAGDDEAVAMINQILEENNYLTVAKLAAMSISMVKSCYVKILNELSARFDPMVNQLRPGQNGCSQSMPSCPKKIKSIMARYSAVLFIFPKTTYY